MANFIGLVYATLKQEGVDTSKMTTDEAVAKFKELQAKNGGKSGEHEGTPAEQRKLKEETIKELEKEINSNSISYEDKNKKMQEIEMLQDGFDDMEEYKKYIKENIKKSIDNTFKDYKNLEEKNKQYGEQLSNKIETITNNEKNIDKNILSAQHYINMNSEDVLKLFKDNNIAYATILGIQSTLNEIKDAEYSYREKPSILKKKVEYLLERFKEKKQTIIENETKEFEYKLKSSKKYTMYLEQMIDIAKNKNYKISKSPYSDSFYLIPKNEEVGWSYKPDGSYRLSDHWNFYSNGEKHCQTSTDGDNKIKMLKYDKNKDEYVDI